DGIFPSHQRLQRFDVAQIVARIINWRFCDEGCVRQPRIIQQTAKWLQPNGSLANVLVAVELGCERRLSIVAMPDRNIAESDDPIQMLQSIFHARFADSIVTGDLPMA